MSCHSSGKNRSISSVLTLLPLETLSYYHICLHNHGITIRKLIALGYLELAQRRDRPHLPLWNQELDTLDILQEEAIQTSQGTLPAHINLFDSNFCFLGNFSWRQPFGQYFLFVICFIVPRGGGQIQISRISVLIITDRNWRCSLQKETESSLFLVKKKPRALN